MQAGWLIAGGAAALALGATLAERRRIRRRETHGIGWVPWPGITLAATFVALIALGLALKT